jgi:hypothetical protein
MINIIIKKIKTWKIMINKIIFKFKDRKLIYEFNNVS